MSVEYLDRAVFLFDKTPPQYYST